MDDDAFGWLCLAASPTIPGFPGLCGAFGLVGFLGLPLWCPCLPWCFLCGCDGFWLEFDFVLSVDTLAGLPGLCILLATLDDDDDEVDDFDAAFEDVFDWIGLIWMWFV